MQYFLFWFFEDDCRWYIAGCEGKITKCSLKLQVYVLKKLQVLKRTSNLINSLCAYMCIYHGGLRLAVS